MKHCLYSTLNLLLLEMRTTPAIAFISVDAQGILDIRMKDAENSITHIRQEDATIPVICVEEFDPNFNTVIIETHRFEQVIAIHYQGGNCNDEIRNLTNISLWAFGKEGNDRLLGSLGPTGKSAKDFLFGGMGDDFLQGFGGGDWLVGGQGKDVIDLGMPSGSQEVADYELLLNGNMTYFPVAVQGGNTESTLDVMVTNEAGYFGKVLLNPFPGFNGEFYTAAGDLNGDGVEDLVCGSGEGSLNGHVVVFDGARVLEVFCEENKKNSPGGFDYFSMKTLLHRDFSQGGSVLASLYAFVNYSSGVAVRLADINDDGYDVSVKRTAF